MTAAESTATRERPPVAVLWDQSLVWGLLCMDTLDRLSIPYRLLSGSDVAAGALDAYRVLVVPGGWASHKIRALGEAGGRRLEAFITRGGGYIGFCGGAGMALSRQPSLGLVPLERMALSERLPNASGQIVVRGIPGHPAWAGLPEAIPVSIWWPSQFAWHPLPRSFPQATYHRPGEDITLADLAGHRATLLQGPRGGLHGPLTQTVGPELEPPAPEESPSQTPPLPGSCPVPADAPPPPPPPPTVELTTSGGAIFWTVVRATHSPVPLPSQHGASM
jgi:hypothetical protein